MNEHLHKEKAIPMHVSGCARIWVMKGHLFDPSPVIPWNRSRVFSAIMQFVYAVFL